MKILKTLKSMFTRAPRAKPREAAERVRSGGAVLIDVRERGEWASGVAQGAVTLPLTDLVGARKYWTPFLQNVGDRELLTYCRAGGRSALAARILASEGFRAADAGALSAWKAAGWPTSNPPPPKPPSERAPS